jgi:hypothetical protein
VSPAYQNNPFFVAPEATPGTPTYLFGTLNQDQSNSRIQITNVAVAANVGTVTGLLIEGPPPIVGGLISIQQTGSNGGIFNVKRAIVTATTINLLTAVCTVSFALTNANVSSADSGVAVVEITEVPDTLVAGASIPVAIESNPATQNSIRTIAVVVTFPTLPTAATVILQGAINDVDSEYTQLGSGPAATVAGGAQTVGPLSNYQYNVNYIRLFVSGITGSGTIVGKIIP